MYPFLAAILGRGGRGWPGCMTVLFSFCFPLFGFPCPLPHISVLSLPIGVPGVFVLALITLYPRLILTSEPRRINIVRFAGKN